MMKRRIRILLMASLICLAVGEVSAQVTDFYRIPPDSTGKYIRTWSLALGGKTVHQQAMTLFDTDGNALGSSSYPIYASIVGDYVTTTQLTLALAAYETNAAHSSSLSTALADYLTSATAALTYAPISTTETQSHAASTYVSATSPALIGTPTAPTATPGTATTQIATTAFIATSYAPLASPTFTGTVSGVTKSMVGLGNVDNTTDLGKPISTATQTALDLKAPLASPALTGTPTSPTATDGTNTTQIATTAHVRTALSNALASYLTTATAASTYAPLASPSFTGNVGFPGSGIWNSSGNVGIGTTGPGAKLEVSAASTATAGRFYSGSAKTAVTAEYPLYITTNEAWSDHPFGLEVTINGAAAIANRSIALQTKDVNLSNGGTLVLQPFGGNLSTGGGIATHSRSTPDGEWTAFTPSLGASSGTFSGCTVTAARYMLAGKTETVAVNVLGCSISATPVDLTITIPGGFTAAIETGTGLPFADNGSIGNGVLLVNTGGTQLVLYKDMAASTNWAMSTSNTRFTFVFSFEIQ